MHCVAALVPTMLFAISVGCSSPNGPTAVPASNPSLSIRLPANAALVGKQISLEARLTTEVGEQRVPASWSISPATVAAIDPEGRLTGFVPGSVTVTASYQAYSASIDVDVVNDYSGNWDGTYKVRECMRLSGGGPSYCRFIIGISLPFAFVLSQQGKNVTGTLSFYDTEHRLLLTGSVTGTSHNSGSLAITGTVRSLSGGEQPEITTIPEWNSALISEDDSLIGQFVKNRDFVSGFGPQKSVEQCVIESAHHHE